MSVKYNAYTYIEKTYIYMSLGFPDGSDGKEPACNVGNLGLISGLRRSPEGRHGNPLQYSCLENPWTEEPGGLQSRGPKELDMIEQLRTAQHLCTYLSLSLCRLTEVKFKIYRLIDYS